MQFKLEERMTCRNGEYEGALPGDPRTQIKIAETRSEIEEALELVYHAYLRAGLCKTSPYRMRATPYHLLPTTEIIVAKVNDEIAHTMTLVRDGELGLPMETIYQAQIEKRRLSGLRLAEVSCLADRRKALSEKRGFSLMFRAMCFILQCARHRGVDQVLIAVHPRHAKFYEGYLGFRQCGEKKNYATVCDHPAVALMLDFHALPGRNPRVYHRIFGKVFPATAMRYRPVPEDILADLNATVEATYEQEAAEYAVPSLTDSPSLFI